jgi:hypothetical protein
MAYCIIIAHNPIQILICAMGMIYCTLIAHTPMQTLMCPMGTIYCTQSNANIDVPNGDDLWNCFETKAVESLLTLYV